MRSLLPTRPADVEISLQVIGGERRGKGQICNEDGMNIVIMAFCRFNDSLLTNQIL